MDPRLEVRYVVIKFTDLDMDEFTKLDQFISDNNIPTRDCVVVEEDWPEYQPTVDAILARSNK